MPPAQISRLRPLLPTLLFLGFTVAVFFPALTGNRFFAIDFHLTFEPLRAILGEEILNGMPLWNPLLGNGTPLLANPMHAALYPPNLVFAFVDPAAGLTWLSILHVVLGGVGAYQLARELGSGRIGASAAGLLFGFNGAALSAISYCNLSWTVAWLPWIVLAAELLFRRGPNKKRILVFGAILGIMLVLADPFIIASAALGVLLLAAESLRGARPAQRKRHIAALVLGLAAGLLVVSPSPWSSTCQSPCVPRVLQLKARSSGPCTHCLL